jgi:hypothetical protein
MTATEIQTVAALIQAAAAIIFLATVVCDARRRNRQADEERRKTIIRALQFEFSVGPGGQTVSEAAGILSTRQIEFFNKRLKELGETWTYP